jgi:hypothetical protein
MRKRWMTGPIDGIDVAIGVGVLLVMALLWWVSPP